MAVSLYNTYKLLNAWQRVMNESVWAFNQVLGQGAPDKFGRNVYVQPERDTIAQSLTVAVETATPHLGFYPRPVYLTERVPLRRGVPLERQPLRTRFKHVQAFGQRAVTLIEAGAAVTYSDSDGDGINDRATITVVTALTDPDEIKLFFRVSDGAPGAADDLYEIEPTTVSISGGSATITVHRALLVKPSTIWDVPYSIDGGNYDSKNAASTTDANDFVTAVDVYRVYTDSTNAVQLVADNYYLDYPPAATETLVSASGLLKDSQAGTFMVRPAATCYYRYFEAVEIKYLAGLSLVRGRMHTVAERALVRLANADMPHLPASVTEPPQSRWSYDHDPASKDNLLSPTDLNNPFGIRRGHVDAWRDLSTLVLSGGGKIS